MPAYICDSMVRPLAAAGVETKFYRVNEEFAIDDGVEVGGDELLLLVDYFGICRGATDRARARWGPGRLVLDHSQSFYAAPGACFAAIYSPRKFFGVPDGGLLVTLRGVAEPSEEDAGSVARCEHLLARHAGPPAAGYAAFQRAEGSLDLLEPRKMSRLTARIFGSIDFERVRASRNANFSYLHERLGATNELRIDAGTVDGPLCYPLLSRPGLRDRLLRESIFVPTYWPEVLRRTASGFEAELVTRCVPLPCDQRYGLADLQRVVDVVEGKC